MRIISFLSLITISCFVGTSCKKLVSIPEPVTSITSQEVFSTVDEANSAMAGIYTYLNQNGLAFANGLTTIFCGMSADELLNLGGSTNISAFQFAQNSLLSNNVDVSYFWKQCYFAIYQSNAVISGVASSGGLDSSTKAELTGEATFVRAFCYFYLTNLFGDVPMVLTINYNKTENLPRASKNSIYNQIVLDLKSAQSLLRADYSYSIANGERIIPNKWVATALLARVYLYQKDWADAYSQANAIISNSGTYSLTPNLANIFNANSSEAIWQLKQNTSSGGCPYNITQDGKYFVPSPSTKPTYYITNSLLSSFEPGDLRRTIWIDSTVVNRDTLYTPFKYYLGSYQLTIGGIAPQYYMVMRLTEQYFIRAECEAQGMGSGLSSAISDLNTIRNRAGLPNFSGTSPQQVLDAIYQERRVELFAEWGHRWMDMNRLGMAASIFAASKGVNVSPDQLLYPIPVTELTSDPNLTQNPGYQ